MKKEKITFLLSLSLLVALVFNPFGSSLFELAKLQFLVFFLTICAVVSTTRLVFFRSLKISYNKYTYFFIGFWILSLMLSTLFSIAPELSFWGTYDRVQGFYSQIIYLIFFIIFFSTLNNKKRQEIFLKILLFVASILSIHAILQHFGIGLFNTVGAEEFAGRSFATLGHPNSLGQFLLFPIWASVYFLIESKKSKEKIFNLVVFVLLFTALLLSQNRASLLALFISLGLFLGITAKIKTAYKIIFGILLFAGFLVIVKILDPSIGSLMVRAKLWGGALKLFQENPILGSGLETFKLVFQKVSSSDLYSLEKVYSIADRAHNDFIDILVQQGLFGLITYLGIITATIYGIFKSKKIWKNKMLTISAFALFSTLVTNLFAFPLSSHYLLAVAFLAILLNQTLKIKEIEIKQNTVNLFVAGIIVAISVFATINSIKTIYADNLFFDGKNKIHAGDLAGGVEDVYSAVKYNMHQDDIYFYLGELVYLVGQEAKDMQTLSEAADIVEYGGKFAGYDFRYYFYKAKIESEQGDFEVADMDFQKANELAPINPIILREWGKMYFKKADYAAAIEKFEKLLSLMPEYWKSKNNFENLSEEQKWKYQLFMSNVPDFWEIFPLIIEAYEKTDNQEKANYYKEFIE